MSNGARFTSAQDALTYILSGRAVVTLVSQRTDVRFTYCVSAPTDESDNIRFVSVLAGPDNSHDYTYLGHIFTRDGAYMRGAKSKLAPDAPSGLAFSWSWSWLQQGRLPKDLEVWHEGTCGRCGRRLTTPESLSTGIGPECARRALRT